MPNHTSGEPKRSQVVTPAPSTEPTRYPDLNAVLARLLRDARVALAENFLGAYLTGSFATGDADEFSDVDFIVVTRTDVSEQQLIALQVMHYKLHRLNVSWAQHLQGSYAPAERLRHVDPSRSAFLHLDNGAHKLEFDNHCNTAHMRWVLREHPRILAGPDPKTLVEPVSAEQLRHEALSVLEELVEWAPAPHYQGVFSRWKQTYLVVTLCRVLYTLAFGVVVSKRDAGEWAMTALAPEWSSLIRLALDDRPDPWLRCQQPADPIIVNRTLAFADYALKVART